DLAPLHGAPPGPRAPACARDDPAAQRDQASQRPGRELDLARRVDRSRRRARRVRRAGPARQTAVRRAAARVTRLEPFRDGVWLKREDEHELGAFKWRGAQAVLAARRPAVVVTASTGNHGAATAWAARRSGVRAVVFVPEEASATKLALIEANAAEIRRAGADLDEAKEAARAFAAADGHFFFEDGAEPAQFDGYEAIGREIVDQLGRPPGTVVIPVGNGALAIGVGRGVGAASLRIGVVPEA